MLEICTLLLYLCKNAFNLHRTALLETQYFPSIQYISKFLLYDRIVLEKNEHYQKGSFRNRCEIPQASGWQNLSIPLSKGKNEKMVISEVQIHFEENWQRIHWQSIQTAYGRSPFWEFYQEDIRLLLEAKEDSLFQYNLGILKGILELIGIEWNEELSEKYLKELPEDWIDLRNTILPKNKTQILDPKFKLVKYPQVFLDRLGFSPNASIIDLILCAGPAALSILEDCIE